MLPPSSNMVVIIPGRRVPNPISPKLRERLVNTTATKEPLSHEAIDERQAEAQRRRMEYMGRLRNRAEMQNSKQTLVERQREEEKLLRSLKLQERLSNAAHGAALHVEQRRRRATKHLQRLEKVASHMSQRQAAQQQALAASIDKQLSNAERRRNARREALEEKLKEEHELVTERLANSRGSPQEIEALRKELEARLQAKEVNRMEFLARTVARKQRREGRCKRMLELNQAQARMELELKRLELERRQAEAALRREAQLQSNGIRSRRVSMA